MTTDHEASRTLVKSPPELWAECSDASSLARHLGEFGEIRITRVEPEIIVAWEGERASGTVRIEPSGWGTKVTLTARTEAEEEPEEEPEVAPVPAAPEPPVAPKPPVAQVAPEPPVAPEPQPELVVEQRPAPIAVTPAPRGGLWSRLFGRRGAPEAFAAVLPPEPPPVSVSVPEPEPAAPLPPEPEPVAKPEPERAAPPVPPVPEPTAEGPDATAVLAAALESLGQAHHRPFSRS
jgi:hypothetical protein